METNKRRFLTKGEPDAEFLMKVTQCISRPAWARVTLMVCGIIFAVCVVLLVACGVFTGDWDPLMGILPAGIVMIVVLFLLPAMNRNRLRSAMQKESAEGKYAYTVYFTPMNVYVENATNGQYGMYDLAQVKRVALVDDVWLLITAQNVGVPVWQMQLSKTDRESLLGLLKQRNPRVSIEKEVIA